LHHESPLARLGWDDRRAAELRALGDDVAPARIARVDRGGALAVAEAGEVGVRGSGLAVGDWIALRDGAAAAVLPRRTTLARRAAGTAPAGQVIAANVDVVLVVHALDRPLRLRRLHRALALAWESGAVPALVVTKADLVPSAPVEALLADAALGVAVHTVSAVTGQGVEEVGALAAPARTLVLLGESGAGKSRLTNALVGRDALATGAVRTGDGKGRHTTTARHLLPLPGGGALIDTPGVRELGLWGAEAGVTRAFGDIEALAEGCRFRDCRHETEPGCAVRAAAATGELDPARLESLRDLRRELAADERRRDERASRAHGRRGARAAREATRMKGRRP
jgi:ribosome biogenesis GTPase